ncbi:unnamed protein product, partial [Effrenium voratum]
RVRAGPLRVRVGAGDAVARQPVGGGVRDCARSRPAGRARGGGGSCRAPALRQRLSTGQCGVHCGVCDAALGAADGGAAQRGVPAKLRRVASALPAAQAAGAELGGGGERRGLHLELPALPLRPAGAGAPGAQPAEAP